MHCWPPNCGTGDRLGKQVMRKCARGVSKKRGGAGVGVHAFSPAPRRQKWQVDLRGLRFEVDLVYVGAPGHSEL